MVLGVPFCENHAVQMKSVKLARVGCPLELHVSTLPRLERRDVLIRIRAAGVCHSDAHYRAGRSLVEPLPLTLGHEVAGVVENIGAEVSRFKKGDRVCVHYLATCGECHYCQAGIEQFCVVGQMIGKSRDGGFAEYLVMPERSVFPLPEEIPFEHGAIMMCSSATCFHALKQTRLKEGETVAIFGAGGLGMSAIRLARALGAREVFAIDIRQKKLDAAKNCGAVPVDAQAGDPIERLKELTDGRGVDVALELVGLPLTMRQAVSCLAIKGRAGLVGITERLFEVAPYAEVINKEAEIIGVADHLAAEVPALIQLAREKKLDLTQVVSRRIPLDAGAINETLDRLERFEEDTRVVVIPA